MQLLHRNSNILHRRNTEIALHRRKQESKTVTRFTVWDFIHKKRDIIFLRIIKETPSVVYGVCCNETGNIILNPYYTNVKLETLIWKEAIRRREVWL